MAAREGALTMLRPDETRSPQPLLPPPPASSSRGRGLGGTAEGLSRSTAVVTSLAAGAVAGALAKTAIAPLDRAKINFQTSRTPYSWRAALLFLRHTLSTEGVLALWRGNSATMARIIPYAAIQFTAHEQWKRVLGVDSPTTAQDNPMLHLIAGSLAGVTSQSATYPLDLARARMAVTSVRQYRTLRAVFAHQVSGEGVRALYRGYPATVLGVIPYAGVSFFTYDSLKHKYLDHFNTAPSGIVNVVFGGAAGALGQTASYPLDIVRRRMQTAQSGHNADTSLHAVNNDRTGPNADSNARAGPKDNGAKAVASGSSSMQTHGNEGARSNVHHVNVAESVVKTRIPDIAHCRTIADTLTHVYTTEGVRGFFKGLSMNWVKGPIAVGISFATYDAIKTTLRDLAVRIESS